MRKLIAILAAASLLQCVTDASAQQPISIYKCTTPDGLFEYKVKPVDGSECVGLKGEVPSTRWVQIATGRDGTAVKVDRETIRRDGNVVIAWVEYGHAGNKPYMNYKHAVRTLQRERISCMSMTSATEFYTHYDDQDTVIISGEGSPRQTPIVPDSLSEATWKYLCQP